MCSRDNFRDCLVRSGLTSISKVQPSVGPNCSFHSLTKVAKSLSVFNPPKFPQGLVTHGADLFVRQRFAIVAVPGCKFESALRAQLRL